MTPLAPGHALSGRSRLEDGGCLRREFPGKKKILPRFLPVPVAPGGGEPQAPRGGAPDFLMPCPQFKTALALSCCAFS